MKEYKVTLEFGWFTTRIVFMQGKSAEAIQKEIHEKFSYQMYMGEFHIKDISVV